MNIIASHKLYNCVIRQTIKMINSILFKRLGRNCQNDGKYGLNWIQKKNSEPSVVNFTLAFAREKKTTLGSEFFLLEPVITIILPGYYIGDNIPRLRMTKMY